MTDTDILARTIFGEARSGGKVLMSAVARTILNRVKLQTWYGRTITDVCQKSQQYSCWNPDDPNCEIIQQADTTIPVFNDALAIAAQAVSGTLPDSTNEATHYYSTYIAEPSWAEGHDPCAAIGNMLFFNDIA